MLRCAQYDIPGCQDAASTRYPAIDTALRCAQYDEIGCEWKNSSGDEGDRKGALFVSSASCLKGDEGDRKGASPL